jgi:hypothetical protein
MKGRRNKKRSSRLGSDVLIVFRKWLWALYRSTLVHPADNTQTQIVNYQELLAPHVYVDNTHSSWAHSCTSGCLINGTVVSKKVWIESSFSPTHEHHVIQKQANQVNQRRSWILRIYPSSVLDIQFTSHQITKVLQSGSARWGKKEARMYFSRILRPVMPVRSDPVWQEKNEQPDTNQSICFPARGKISGV